MESPLDFVSSLRMRFIAGAVADRAEIAALSDPKNEVQQVGAEFS